MFYINKKYYGREKKGRGKNLACILQQGLEFGAFNAISSVATLHWKKFPKLKINTCVLHAPLHHIQIPTRDA